MVAFKRYREDKSAVLLIDDLHVLADEIADLIDEKFMDGVCIVTSARVGEWNDKIGKFLGSRAQTIGLGRFKTEDISEIIRAIGSNFAAPSFNKLPSDKKHERFARSKQQLLIALLEATEAKGFREIIEDEFTRITDTDQRQLFLIVALATVPRVGVSKAMASSILSMVDASADFDKLAQALQGIIDVSPSGRYQARHQVYALEIIQKYASFTDIVAARSAMINYYARYAAPIIKHISAHDGQLFKYLLNNAHIFNMYDSVNKRAKADEFYSSFEITLQLDGHYWLQYALLLRRLGRQGDALEMLGRSIQAYPANLYAQHALAQQKLIVAAQRGEWSTETRALVSDAVATLLQRHNSMGTERARGAIDEYPIVALGYYHIDALIAHKQNAEAIQAARTYFREIDRLDRVHPDEILQELKGKLLNLVTTSQWRPVTYRVGQIEYK